MYHSLLDSPAVPCQVQIIVATMAILCHTSIMGRYVIQLNDVPGLNLSKMPGDQLRKLVSQLVNRTEPGSDVKTVEDEEAEENKKGDVSPEKLNQLQILRQLFNLSEVGVITDPSEAITLDNIVLKKMASQMHRNSLGRSDTDRPLITSNINRHSYNGAGARKSYVAKIFKQMADQFDELLDILKCDDPDGNSNIINKMTLETAHANRGEYVLIESTKGASSG